MNIKNMLSRSTKRVNRSTIEGLAIGLVELSERDLQHISGGTSTAAGCGGNHVKTTVSPNGTITVSVSPCHCKPVKKFDALVESELLLDDSFLFAHRGF